MSKPDVPANVLASQLPRIREFLDRAVAEAINKAAGSIRDLREWCDRADAGAYCSHRDTDPAGVRSCDVCELVSFMVEEVRALLPPVHESGSPDP